jgi:threonine dehydratase
MEALLIHQNLVAEGAGAAGLAGVTASLAAAPTRFKGRKIGIVVSGGNVDARLLSNVLMRGMVYNGRLVRLRVAISDTPGTLARVAGIVGAVGGNIVEVAHQRLFDDVPVKLADLDLVIETRGPDHIGEIEAALAAAGYRTQLLSHMVG